MNSKEVRVDPKFEKAMRNAMRIRYDKDLVKLTMKDMGLPEATRLLMRTENFPKALKEMEWKPKKL